MAPYHILIVDDQKEVRDVLGSALETLGPNFRVVTVPSGEEALLEIQTSRIDLLVSDVILPGMSGLELMKKVRNRHPDLKVILVTGAVDRQIRREVADAGADAFFLKPMNPADFLDAVERILGLVETSTVFPDLLETEPPLESMSARLAKLRQELDSISVTMLDDRGRILAQAGDLPDASDESSLLPTLMASFSANGRVARFLGANPPQHVSYFSGPKYDLILARVGAYYALLVVVTPLSQALEVSQVMRRIFSGVSDLHEILVDLGINLEGEGLPTPIEPTEPEEDSDEEAPRIDALFQKAEKVTPPLEDVDEFWDSLVKGDASAEITSADALTYEQALRLGLAPETDENEE